MNEPFMFATSADLPEGTYSYAAPIRFRDPSKAIRLVPMDSQVMSGDRPFYTDEWVRSHQDFVKSAIDNTAQIGFRSSLEKDLVSIRSAKASGTPCSAALLLQGPKRRARLMGCLTDILQKNGMPDAKSHYFVFITPDEILLADSGKIRPNVLRRMIKDVKNQLESSDPGLLLSTEVLEYDQDEDVFREV